MVPTIIIVFASECRVHVHVNDSCLSCQRLERGHFVWIGTAPTRSSRPGTSWLYEATAPTG